jgi:glycosyltransferase involved in cell wall biosynthesis
VNPGLTISPLPKRQSVTDRFGLDQNFRYISWLGRLVKIKRADRLLEIAYWLKVNYPDVRILVAGDGPLREEIEKKATQSHLPIQFLGWVLDIESVLAVSEIMILTSDNEGTPLSLIQAQMAGLPVVATDVGSTSEIVINNETGLIVPTSVELINKAIGALLQDQQKARLMGQRARIRALELYSIERLVRDHEKIYLELMSSV